MSIEFIGMIQTSKVSETHAPQGPVIDVGYLEQFARAHEAAGFDRILVPHHSTSPDALLTVAHAASVTSNVHFMLAHRPGFVAPTLAARQLATLDHYSRGRLAYARTDEYLQILRRLWTEAKPFDHHGQYYRFEQGFSEVKPVQQPHIPVYFGGASAPALEIAGRHADVYALWGESKAQVREQVTRVRAEAAKHGRTVRFSVSFRPILAATESAAWERAERILAETKRLRALQGLGVGGPAQSEGARRLLAASGESDRADERLWTGFDPLEDAIDYGRELIPATRERVARVALAA
ncbi:MAG: LLM class flavin-dependent oxidoreductase [Burkholderia sp.]|nr:LLM class flavin-dependent oxidoreductase [Burkholderia sp.]